MFEGSSSEGEPLDKCLVSGRVWENEHGPVDTDDLCIK